MPLFLCPSGEGLLRQPGWMPWLCWAAETQGFWKGYMKEIRPFGKCQCPAELGNMAPWKTKVQGHFHSCAPSKGLAQHSSALPQRPWPGYVFDLLYEAEAFLASALDKKLFQKKETEFKVVLSDTWLNPHMSIISLFTILPPWLLWLLEPAYSSLPYWIPPPRSCGCSGNTSVQLQPDSGVVQPRCAVIFRGTTLPFFSPSLWFLCYN